MEKKEMFTKTMLGMFIVMNFILNMSASLFNGILDQVAVEMNVPVTVYLRLRLYLRKHQLEKLENIFLY